jgi:hypothetical protein
MVVGQEFFLSSIIMRQWLKWAYVVLVVLHTFFWLHPSFEQKGPLLGSREEINSEEELDEDYERYYELEAIQELWNMPLMRQEGYPITKERWKQVANTTCRSSPDNQHSHFLTWQGRKIPHAIVIGCQKCGSTAMAHFFRGHPDIVVPKQEIHFLSRFMDSEEIPTYTSGEKGGINQTYWQEQYHLYLRHYTDAMQKNAETQFETIDAAATINSSDSVDSMIGEHENDGDGVQARQGPTTGRRYLVEKTPNYILLSDRVPQRLLCICPWSKLILILRDPVDRAFSHYNMDWHGYQRRGPKDKPPFPSFDEWIRSDYNVLVALGVLSDEATKANKDDSQIRREGYQGTLQERQGWAAYTKLAAIGSTGGVSRGLYSLQIMQWMEAFRIAKQPLDLLVLSAEAERANPQETFNQICDHLGIARYRLKQIIIGKGSKQSGYSDIPPMSNVTRQWLEDVYQPYNEQLTEMLGKQFWNMKKSYTKK